MLRMRRLVAIALASALALLAGPVPAQAAGGQSSTGSAGAVVPTSLSIMTFNIEYGGTVVDFDKILAAVRRADADVVAFNEAYGKVAKLGRLTDYDYVSRRLDLVSRYPIVDAPGSGGRYVFVQLAPGNVVAVANVHLSSSDYGPRRLLDGWSRRKVLRTERRLRVPDLRPFLQATDDSAGRRHPHVRRGRHELPLARGLDPGHGRPAAADPFPGRVAGDRAARAQGVRRLVARRAP